MTDLEALKNATIMMVDDEPTTLDVLEVLLQELGSESFVKATEVLKYVLPIGLLLLGVLAWRRRHGGTDSSG